MRMQNEEEFSIGELMNGITKAGQKIIQNYFKNF